MRPRTPRSSARDDEPAAGSDRIHDMTRVTLTGATGLIGTRLVRALRERGAEVTVLTRSPERARETFGAGVQAHAWDPVAGPAPTEALAGRDAVVHLAGENVAQRGSDDSKRRISDSRELGTRNLVAGLRAADPPRRTRHGHSHGCTSASLVIAPDTAAAYGWIARNPVVSPCA